MTTMDKFIDDYLKRGFGSMTKRDFEVFIMHQLLQGKLKGKSNYEISRELRISEAKVKNLIYEVSLKYDTDVEAQKERLISLLKRVHIYAANSNVMFVVEDVATRNYLNQLLKEEGRTLDYKQNSEFIVLKREDFITLLEKLFTEQEKQRISDHAGFNLDGDEGPLDKGFKDYMRDILNKIIEKGKDKAADLTFEGILKLVSKLAVAAII